MDLPFFNDENDLSYYWNNWSPSNQQEESCSDQNPKKVTKEVVFKSEKSLLSYDENHKYGNWIPPLNFSSTDYSRNKKVPINSSQRQSQRHSSVLNQSYETEQEKLEVSEISFSFSKENMWKKVINLDWGKRAELHDVTKFNDGDTIWGVVNLGIFGTIKVWINEYGNICGLAEGRISKVNSLEMSFICITNVQLLRKMLGLSGAQWASLCESLQETKTTLKFDAFQNWEISTATSLDKLWNFICKRRHFLPNQCMQVKLCGAVKCMKKFSIIPKLVVQDIRSISGESLP